MNNFQMVFMDCICCCCFVLCVFLMFLLVGSSYGGPDGLPGNGGKMWEKNETSFISWDDIKVDQRILDQWPNVSSTRVIVVNKEGCGDSVTVQGAIDMVPENNRQRVKIYILPGIYREKVTIPKSKPFIAFVGGENQMSNTIITWNDKASNLSGGGAPIGTYRSASVTIESNYFCATEITFENTVVAVPAKKGMQAVALRIAGDKAMFYKVKAVGTQDTLLDERGTHYFYQCHILGTVDFIFGNSRSLYQDCVLESIAKTNGAIAAHHRGSACENTGFSFVNCTVNGTGTVLLGRAWGFHSRVIYSNCYFDNVVSRKGWSDWNDINKQKTAIFAEFDCRGPGSDTSKRVSWSKKFIYDEAKPFMDIEYIDGEKWLRL